MNRRFERLYMVQGGIGDWIKDNSDVTVLSSAYSTGYGARIRFKLEKNEV